MAYDLGTAHGVIELEYNGKGVKQAQQDVGSLTDKNSKAGQALSSTGRVAGIAGAAIAGGLALGIKSAADFEQRLSAINAVSGATPKQMDAVRAKALQLGKDTAFSAGESAQAMEELIKSGISIPDVMNGAADATVALAAAGEVDLPTAATIASNAMNQFDISAQKMPHVADQIAGAANASAIDVHDFGESMKQAGAVANLAGVSFEDTTTAIALMGNAGIKGSDAGTALKTMLSRLQPTTKKQQNTMEDLGLINFDAAKGMQVLRENGIKPLGKDSATVEKQLHGLAARLSGSKVGSETAEKKFNDLALSTDVLSNSFYDAQGNTKSLKDISGQLAKATEGMTKKQKQAALQTLFGSDAIRAAAILTKEGAKGFDGMAKSIAKVKAADVAKKRLDNFKGSMEQLKGSLETAGITMGTILLPAMRKIVDAITSMLNKFLALSPGMQKAIVIAAALTSGLLLGFAAFVKVTQGIKAMQEGMLALKTALVGAAAAENTTTLAAIRGKIASIAAGAAEKAKAVALGIVKVALLASAAAQWALNAAMTANPIGIIIALIVALVAVFILLWKKNDGFRKAVIAAWNAIKNAAVATWNAIKDAIVTAWNKVHEWLKTAIDAVVNFVKDHWQLLVGIFLGPIALVVALIIKHWDKIKSFTKAVFSAIGKFLKKIWEGIKKAIQGEIERLKSGFENTWNGIKNVVTKVAGAIKDFLGKVWGKIKDIAGNVWDNIKENIGNKISAVHDVISNIMGNIKEVMGNIWDAIKTAAGNIWDAIKSTVTTRIQNLMNNIQTIKGKITGFFSGAGSWLLDAGKKIIGGLIDGVTAMAGKVADAVGNVVSKAKDLLPGSPVKEGPLKVLNRGHAGKQIMQMVIDGIDKMERPMAEAMNRSMPAMQTNVSAAYHPVPPPAARLPRGGGRGGQKASRLVHGKLSIDRRGRAFIQGIAEDAADDALDFEDTRRRMG